MQSNVLVGSHCTPASSHGWKIVHGDPRWMHAAPDAPLLGLESQNLRTSLPRPLVAIVRATRRFAASLFLMARPKKGPEAVAIHPSIHPGIQGLHWRPAAKREPGCGGQSSRGHAFTHGFRRRAAKPACSSSQSQRAVHDGWRALENRLSGEGSLPLVEAASRRVEHWGLLS